MCMPFPFPQEKPFTRFYTKLLLQATWNLHVFAPSNRVCLSSPHMVVVTRSVDCRIRPDLSKRAPLVDVWNVLPFAFIVQKGTHSTGQVHERLLAIANADHRSQRVY